jgi:hypothetical protein
MCKKLSFFLLFVLWTLHNMCIFYVKTFCALSLQYFEKSVFLRFRRIMSVLLLHLSVCFVSL